jgi:hypothetical protein
VKKEKLDIRKLKQHLFGRSSIYIDFSYTVFKYWQVIVANTLKKELPRNGHFCYMPSTSGKFVGKFKIMLVTENSQANTNKNGCFLQRFIIHTKGFLSESIDAA